MWVLEVFLGYELANLLGLVSMVMMSGKWPTL